MLAPVELAFKTVQRLSECSAIKCMRNPTLSKVLENNSNFSGIRATHTPWDTMHSSVFNRELVMTPP